VKTREAQVLAAKGLDFLQPRVYTIVKMPIDLQLPGNLPPHMR